MNPARLVATAVAFAVLMLGLPAEAHRFAPSLLRLFEIGDNSYNVVWKTPAQATSTVSAASAPSTAPSVLKP